MGLFVLHTQFRLRSTPSPSLRRRRRRVSVNTVNDARVDRCRVPDVVLLDFGGLRLSGHSILLVRSYAFGG